MGLAASTSVGPYRVLRALGRGGMGEVYVAMDDRLGREVAVKMMHPGLAAGGERLRRFEQEARAASAINHPNIVTVFDVGSLDGAPYIVTELLDGDSLRDLLSGPLGLRKSLDLAAQIAHGLAAAHDRGIVHRDIKPENLFVTRDGRLKILDFGVAKLSGLDDDDVVTDERPTTPALTTPDSILGTPGYMAPEQVKGDPVDHRADLFALGAVLYEMLTGKRAFAGKAAHAVMYQVLHGEPAAYADSGVVVPPMIAATINRCLEKRRDERFASARDLAFQLEALATGNPSSATVDIPARPLPRAPRRGVRRIAIAVVGAVVVVAALTWWRWPRSRPTQPTTPAATAPVARADALPDRVPELKPLTFRSGRVTSARRSHDGRTLYVGAAWNGEPQQLYAIGMGRPETMPLGVEGDVVAVAPDGDLAVLLGPWNGFEQARTLALIPPTAGGAQRVIAEGVQSADVGADGAIAIVRRVDTRCRVEYPIGTVIDETSGWFSHLRISPDGKRVAYLVHPMREDDRGWPVIATAGTEPEPLSGEWSGTQGIAWDPAGRGIYFSASYVLQRAIWFAGDGAPPRRIVQVTGNLDIYDAFDDGSLLGVTWEWDVHARLRVADATEEDISWFDVTNPIDLAPDGRTLLFVESGLAVLDAIYIAYLRRPDGVVVRLGPGVPQRLSPDGKQVLMLAPATLKLSIVPTGAGTPRALDTGDLTVQGAWWFPDGKRILLSASEPGDDERLWVMALDGKHEALTEPGQSARRHERALSPDGALVSYADRAGLRRSIAVDGRRAVPAPAIEPGERFIGWYADSRDWIVAREDPDGRHTVTRLAPDGTRAPLAEIAPPTRGGRIAEVYFQIAPDGRGWAFAYFSVASRAYALSLVSPTAGTPAIEP